MNTINKVKIIFLFFIFLCCGIIVNTLFNVNSTNITTTSNNDKFLNIQNDSFSLKNSNNIPEIPELLYPLNESIFNSNIVQFNWNLVGQSSDKIFYDFVMDNDSDFNSPELARFALNDWSNFTMFEDQYTTFIAHFNDTLFKSAELEAPMFNTGCKIKQGRFGNGVFINSSELSKLTYNVSGNLYKNNGTIEFWVKLEKDIEEITNYEFLFDYIISASPKVNRIIIAISPDHDRVYAETWFNTTGRGIVFPPDKTPWKKGEWHHVCLTWGNEMGRLYLDGLEVAASTYFPIGNGTLVDDFSIGSQYGVGNWVNATFDELRISTVQRLPIWKPENGNMNGTYLLGAPFYRYPIWNLNKTEFYHMFERDDIYFWKVRAHNASGPGQWSKTRVLTINRTLDQRYQVQIKILDKNGFEIPNVNVSYQQETVSKLMGVDANYISELLKYGMAWYHEGSLIDFYTFLSSRQSNSFRTRLWTNNNGNNNLANATNMARWARNNGSIPYLTIFLSDDWSDVNKATLPKIFEGLSFEEKLVAIEDYCRDVTQNFINEGINMEFYEIGNEIDFGLCGLYANTSSPRYNLTWLKENIWYNESRILKAAISGVKQADPTAEFMLHIAISDPAFSMAFFTAMKDYGVSYNIMGLSYHPVINGDAAENGFKETIKVLSCSGLPGYNKLILPETSYSSQINGSSYFKDWNKRITEFPLTPEGQKQWVKYQLEWIYQHPNVIGMNYWSPELYDTIWQGFSWFNGTGHSKIVVDAYPDFFKTRNVSINGWQISDNNGNTFFQAYRGKILLKVQYGNHIEFFNISASPFRNNNFNIRLSLTIYIPATSDDDDGKDGKDPTITIPGYNIFILIGILFLFSMITIKKTS